MQARLKFEHNINTSDVNLNVIPKSLHERLKNQQGEDGKVKIGLIQSYELLAELNTNDPLARAFAKLKSRLTDDITKRNHSIHAHGFQTVTELDFQRFHEHVKTLLENFPQLAGINCPRCQEVTQFQLASFLTKKMK